MSLTWNMGGENPDAKVLDKLFMKDGILHDMYILASQEALRSIQMSILMPNKENFNQTIVDYFAGKLDGQEPVNVPEDD